MKNLVLHNELGAKIELVDVENLKDYLPENCTLEVYGFGKSLKGRGHWEIRIDVLWNGNSHFLSTTTTDSLSLDNYYSDTFSEEDEQAQADGLESLIAQILRNNDLEDWPNNEEE